MTFQQALTLNALQKISLAKMVQAMGVKMSTGESYTDLWLHIRYIRQFQKVLDVQFDTENYDLAVIVGSVNKITLYLGNYFSSDTYTPASYIEVNANGQRSVDQSNVTFLSLADVNLATYTGKEGQVLAINGTGTGIITKSVYTQSEVDALVAAGGAVDSVNGLTGVVVLTKSHVGLSNVDNTSDANKPISTATQTALNTKEDSITAGTTTQFFRGDKTWQTLNTTAVTEGSNQYFTEARVRSSVLTGYAVGANAALAATDSILSAFGKIQAQINNIAGGTGTVTSVGMTVPTGLSVTPASISTSGTFALTFTSGYSIPTTANQTNWSTAYGWGDHSTQSYIKLSSAITGYTTGTNTALAASDTLLAALGKLQGQINAKGVGTVTSVGLTLPTGLSASPASITSSGTFAVTFTSGYSIPTTANQTNWSTAYGWGDHSTQSYIKLSSVLTGYTVGANSALAATDTVLAAFGKIQGQINAKANSSDVITKTGNTILQGTGNRSVSVNANGDLSATNLEVEGFVTDTDVITAITGGTYNSGNNYTVTLTPANGKVFYAGQFYKTGGDLYVAVADNSCYKVGAAGITLNTAITGYAVGPNSVLAATDTILQAFGKLQGQFNNFTSSGGTGTVTSVGMTVPTGLSVSPSTISTSGTFAVTYVAGYAIPTTAKQTDWDTAFGWGNHATQSYIKLSSAITGYAVGTNTALAATDTLLVALGKIQAQLDNKQASGSYEPAITAGTTSQYYRGDKSWQTLDKTAVGLSNVPNTDATNATNLASGTVPAARMPALTGDVTSTVGTVATTIAAATVTGKALTGYTAGTNTALAATDTILAAFGKVQGQITAREGTITAGTTSQYYRGDKSWQTLDKTAVGLANVDNTSDANKPVSTATQTALNAKEGTITAGTTSQYWRGDKSWQTLDKTAVGLSNVDNTSDASKPISTATQTALNNKVEPAASTPTTILKIWSGSQAQYNALTPSSDTLYIIV